MTDKILSKILKSDLKIITLLDDLYEDTSLLKQVNVAAHEIYNLYYMTQLMIHFERDNSWRDAEKDMVKFFLGFHSHLYESLEIYYTIKKYVQCLWKSHQNIPQVKSSVPSFARFIEKASEWMLIHWNYLKTEFGSVLAHIPEIYMEYENSHWIMRKSYFGFIRVYQRLETYVPKFSEIQPPPSKIQQLEMYGTLRDIEYIMSQNNIHIPPIRLYHHSRWNFPKPKLPKPSSPKHDSSDIKSLRPVELSSINKRNVVPLNNMQYEMLPQKTDSQMFL